MNLIPRDQLTDFDRVWDSFFAPARNGNKSGFFAPQVDIQEQPSHYVILADLPGVKKEDIHVSLEDGMLTLKAEHSSESNEEKDGKVIRSERRVGKFSRSFAVGRHLKPEDISGDLQDGVLKIVVPKASADQQAANTRVLIN